MCKSLGLDREATQGECMPCSNPLVPQVPALTYYSAQCPRLATTARDLAAHSKPAEPKVLQALLLRWRGRSPDVTPRNTAQVLLAYKLANSVFDVQGWSTAAQFTGPLLLGPWAGVMAETARRQANPARRAAPRLWPRWWRWSWPLRSLGRPERMVPRRRGTGQRAHVRLSRCPRGTSPCSGWSRIGRLWAASYDEDSGSYNVGRMLGPRVVVVLLAPDHYGWAFIANGLSFIVFTTTLLLVRHGKAEPEVRSRVRDGFVIARRERVILLLLLMVAAVTVADDPILVLGPTIAHHLGASPSWAGWFIAALGAGNVLGSLRRAHHMPTLSLAASALAALGVCMVLFVATSSIWVSFAAAVGAGVTCLLANSMTRTLLSHTAGPARVAPVMAVWAIAWAGSKPIASLVDGSLAGLIGYRATGILLALPVFAPLIYLMIKRYLRRTPDLELQAAEVEADNGITNAPLPR